MNTSEQLKAEAIRKAWIAEIGEENYKKIMSIVGADGWAYLTIFAYRLQPFLKSENIEFIYYSDSIALRPKSLSGIDNNNGWIRIEPDGSNLPNDSLLMFGEQPQYEWGLFSSDGNWYYRTWNAKNWFVLAKEFKNDLATHYKPIEESKPPIF